MHLGGRRSSTNATPAMVLQMPKSPNTLKSIRIPLNTIRIPPEYLLNIHHILGVGPVYMLLREDLHTPKAPHRRRELRWPQRAPHPLKPKLGDPANLKQQPLTVCKESADEFVQGLSFLV